MRGETIRRQPITHTIDISIRSPHARGDHAVNAIKRVVENFNPLPSCEGRHWALWRRLRRKYFNPLPSCEGRQDRKPISKRNLTFQSAPLMRGETQDYLADREQEIISIRSPHARGDVTAFRLSRRVQAFQSAPLMRGETEYNPIENTDRYISIRSPHARGDL